MRRWLVDTFGRLCVEHWSEQAECILHTPVAFIRVGMVVHDADTFVARHGSAENAAAWLNVHQVRSCA